MTDIVVNAAKGTVAQLVADNAAKFGVMLLKTAESDALLATRTTITNVLAHNTEANFTNYARKTAITATVSVDQVNNWVNVDIPDQTWTSAGGGSNNTLAKLIVYYENAAADTTRIPLVALDFVITTDGTDLTAQVAATGFYRAS